MFRAQSSTAEVPQEASRLAEVSQGQSSTTDVPLEIVVRGDKAPARTVITCYAIFDKFFPTVGLLDYTEGIYNDDPSTPYEQAKQNQFDYLLNEVQCGPGVRILDLGCGNGTLLEAIRARGGTGIGISITPEQVDLCQARGLDARLADFLNLGSEWNGKFDAIVANGPIEHFVQIEDAARGLADKIYSDMFATMRRLLDPSSRIRRVVNTTVHFARAPRPEDLLKGPLSFRPYSDKFHYSLLVRSFGGFYPVDGQLERCAQGSFELIREVDGTRDYFFTSEEWLRRVRRALFSLTGFKIFARAIPMMFRAPKQLITMITCMLITQSWNWQFRSDDPPAKLWRQTWSCLPVE